MKLNELYLADFKRIALFVNNAKQADGDFISAVVDDSENGAEEMSELLQVLTLLASFPVVKPEGSVASGDEPNDGRESEPKNNEPKNKMLEPCQN